MKNLVFILVIIFGLYGCASKKIKGGTYGSPKVKQELIDDRTFRISKFSQDSTYGYDAKNPIMVGNIGSGPMNERRFLNALLGPEGEYLDYERLGSCCPFATHNNYITNKDGMGMGLLDMYLVKFKGTDKQIKLYINMYDSDTLRVPVGFILKEM